MSLVFLIKEASNDESLFEKKEDFTYFVMNVINGNLTT